MKIFGGYTLEEARKEQEAADMRRILLKFLWDEFEKDKRSPRPWPFPPMNDDMVKERLKRILGF